MKKKRERLDVIFDILNCIQEKQEIGPTRLLQMSNLSPKMFRDYITELTGSELIVLNEEKKKKKFILTEKGFAFIEKYKKFSFFIDQLGL